MLALSGNRKIAALLVRLGAIAHIEPRNLTPFAPLDGPDLEAILGPEKFLLDSSLTSPSLTSTAQLTSETATPSAGQRRSAALLFSKRTTMSTWLPAETPRLFPPSSIRMVASVQRLLTSARLLLPSLLTQAPIKRSGTSVVLILW